MAGDSTGKDRDGGDRQGVCAQLRGARAINRVTTVQAAAAAAAAAEAGAQGRRWFRRDWGRHGGLGAAGAPLFSVLGYVVSVMKHRNGPGVVELRVDLHVQPKRIGLGQRQVEHRELGRVEEVLDHKRR